MGTTEKIKILLVKRGKSAAQLAVLLGFTPQNLYNKFKRDNFSTNELQKIAEALGCDYDSVFTLRDSGEKL